MLFALANGFSLHRFETLDPEPVPPCAERSAQSPNGSFPWPSNQSIASKNIPRLSISVSRSAACFFQSGVSRTRNRGSSPCFSATSRRQRAADGLVHHRQAVICEGWIIHRVSTL